MSDYLTKLSDAAELRDRLERGIAGTVKKARSEGVSWAQIGTALGMSKQGAQQRYAATEAEFIEGCLDYAREVLTRP